MPSGDKGPALIDTGNPESQLPEEAVRKLADQFGSEFVEEDGSIAAFDCSRAQGTMRFGFNQDKAVVEVPIEMMMIPKSITKSEGCDLALTAGDTVSLGSPFLQAAYVVFDDENKRIMFAQAVMNTTRSDIEAVGPDWKGTASGTG
ncbi:hypothetical protein CDD81_3534 [Ophiocordyceps australis]|uniref:Peptidase A1 domain-containing protein n=1 Tax=Ophiocordyceps australis TaxID=1399860 RepID=A0A2C5XX01_9HYPO|nr:hypothetical protein CDD81_3534 [Ophiocordyceps australis]